MATARVSRGRKTQELVAEWFRGKGWPEALSTPASLPGVDIQKMLGLAPEVKATAAVDPTGWLRQAVANAKGDLPFVVYRPKGFGPERIDGWPVIIRLDDFTDLLSEAGYGGWR